MASEDPMQVDDRCCRSGAGGSVKESRDADAAAVTVSGDLIEATPVVEVAAAEGEGDAYDFPGGRGGMVDVSGALDPAFRAAATSAGTHAGNFFKPF